MSGKTIAPRATRRALGPFVGALVAAALTASALAATAVAAPPSTAPSGDAPGGPGAQSYLGVARKDCFGTARNTTSKVWFTVAGGVLSDVFSPNIEATNVSTVQYIVTDGRTFAALQQRDMTYSLSSPDPSGMVCRVTSTDRAHDFRLISDYITDPARSSVVVHTRLQPLNGDAGAVSKLKVYVRYDATIDNSGGGEPPTVGPTMPPSIRRVRHSSPPIPPPRPARSRPRSSERSSPITPSWPSQAASSAPRAMG